MGAPADLDSAHCPACESRISTVAIVTLRGEKSDEPVTFWACPECETLLRAT